MNDQIMIERRKMYIVSLAEQVRHGEMDGQNAAILAAETIVETIDFLNAVAPSLATYAEEVLGFAELEVVASQGSVRCSHGKV